MHEESNNEWSRLFEQLPVDLSSSEQQRESAKLRALDVFDNQPTPHWQPVTLQAIGRTLMKYKIPHGIAAMVFIAAGFWLMPLVSAPALALDELIDNFMKAHSARYDAIVTVEGQPAMNSKCYYLEPVHLREEYDGFTSITDWAARKKIGLDTRAKRATVYNLNNLPDELKNGMRDGNWFEGIRQMLRAASTNPDAKVIQLGEKEIDGHDVVGFRLEIPATPMTVWADSRTQLPVRIESTMVGPPKTEVVMTNFEFDTDLDKSLFSVEVPAGFAVADVDIDLSPATESDLLTALRMCCEVSDGDFPTGFDAVSSGKYAAKYLVKNGINAKTGPTRVQLQEITKIARGFQFVMMLPKGADVHYAGAGAKQGDEERPVLWYKASGSSMYRVLHADFSVREVDEAPRVADAIELSR
ncbi:MAG: hypothetical protein KDB03_04625 [Planctomycetales bacterium]|nr:hypothetical protein [Planctomycetales bacterium]